ncbi:MAG TPA: indole-3-glycerol phosphate synthase TrpC [Geminicoccus sp.]|jgi:indole-3-glycerol phosphate synthase|uniref:indole-3-glycerol phosphate synthase TrpC n=1 Tax=Geminicoccus sp. TaxID=2024832 RepID=UPI002E3182E1|nr:indole-3-glycerol phosphate synthase TrpC [Geminicoccus sp.]HEX2527675.1 indole-3-glycerol phosphate synthase TrpC [Geminicoccus sp.]
MRDVLAEICERKRAHVAARKRQQSFAALAAELPAKRPRGFAVALAAKDAGGGLPLIAEIKKASPSKGLIRPDFDAMALARDYQRGGATCLSVLTDAPYFQGADEYLVLARESVSLPVLRKDFMLDPWQIVESRWMGADCILLIMACLSPSQAEELAAAAFDLAMDVIVEVHDEAELDRALRLPHSCLLGINNRDLKTLQVDLGTFERLAVDVPPGRQLVAESGLNVHDDLIRMRRAGAKAYLVGESLMREADVAAATQRLLNPA